MVAVRKVIASQLILSQVFTQIILFKMVYQCVGHHYLEKLKENNHSEATSHFCTSSLRRLRKKKETKKTLFEIVSRIGPETEEWTLHICPLICILFWVEIFLSEYL